MPVPFTQRHIGTDADAQSRMLQAVGYGSLEALVDAAIPPSIHVDRFRASDDSVLPPAATEREAITELRSHAARNTVKRSMIGLGYYDTITPAVIKRNVLENPSWYTAYTPYQPEISQGRLEALINFQTVISDLTALDVAGASLLDEATAAAEAMTLARRASRGAANVFVVDADALPQTKAVLRTRAEPIGIELVESDFTGELPECFGVLVQYPGASGRVRDFRAIADAAHARGAQMVAAADLLALTMLAAPGELGADISIGSSQRFGVPLGFGGPHAAYMAVREGLQRQMPGRLVGVSQDADRRPAYRLALQTREQHIRREKATSNICTAQVLLAVIAGMYAVYHGPEGLRRIGRRAHRHAVVLAEGLRQGGVEVVHDTFFDTVLARVPGRAAEIVAAARDNGINLRLADADHVGITCDEKTELIHLEQVLAAFEVNGAVLADLDSTAHDALPTALVRVSDYLTHPVFHSHRSETALLRYLRKLQDKDIALDRSKIPLGSCTMKLNATTEMEPITWPEFAGLHPYAPEDQARGYIELIKELEGWLAEVTGYDAVSIQPNAGS
ncbi:MAG: Glycine dehydrogenase (decarboxylating), partial [Microbacteriaceae bacterium]|nr:Glycine dehydrogenase (decarboxylating) [Microbacteriaceae bacterium]